MQLPNYVLPCTKIQVFSMALVSEVCRHKDPGQTGGQHHYDQVCIPASIKLCHAQSDTHTWVQSTYALGEELTAVAL